jgi:hypothetical protein
MESTQTSLKIMQSKDNDHYTAMHSANQLVHILQRFIPDACLGDARDYIADICFKEGIELTSKQMRKEYEAWKQTEIDLLAFKPR